MVSVRGHNSPMTSPTWAITSQFLNKHFHFIPALPYQKDKEPQGAREEDSLSLLTMEAVLLNSSELSTKCNSNTNKGTYVRQFPGPTVTHQESSAHLSTYVCLCPLSHFLILSPLLNLFLLLPSWTIIQRIVYKNRPKAIENKVTPHSATLNSNSKL